MKSKSKIRSENDFHVCNLCNWSSRNDESYLIPDRNLMFDWGESRNFHEY